MKIRILRDNVNSDSIPTSFPIVDDLDAFSLAHDHELRRRGSEKLYVLYMYGLWTTMRNVETTPDFVPTERARLSVMILCPWPLSSPLVVTRLTLAGLRNRYLPARAWLRSAKETKPAKDRALKVAWGIFLVVGVPLGLMAVLGPLAYVGIYVEPLRQFWRPWPPDPAKAFIGIAGFAATLAYLCYRSGRTTGYRSGNAAGKAVARNLAELAEAPPLVPPAPPEPAPPPEILP